MVHKGFGPDLKFVHDSQNGHSCTVSSGSILGLDLDLASCSTLDSCGNIQEFSEEFEKICGVYRVRK